MKKLICIVVLLLTLGLFNGCSKVSDEDLRIAREAIKNGGVIVDVRTPKEFNQKHIKGALNIPIESIMKNGINIPKDRKIVVYCRTGSRSSMVARMLKENGWEVYDVATQGEWEREIKTK